MDCKSCIIYKSKLRNPTDAESLQTPMCISISLPKTPLSSEDTMPQSGDACLLQKVLITERGKETVGYLARHRDRRERKGEGVE